MSIVHIISTETSDRYGDIVRAEGLDTGNYKKNPVVLYGHDQRAFPVGKSLWQKVTTLPNGQKGVLAKTQFTKSTEEGRTVYQLWKEGLLNAASIGFLPIDYEPILDNKSFVGYDFKASELLEYSIVPVPANQEALRLALEKGFGGSEKVLGELRKQVQHEEFEVVKSDVAELKAMIAQIKEELDTQQAYNLSVAQDTEKLAMDVKELKSYQAESVAKQKADRLNKLVQDAVRGALSK
jgi:HK97 family phage prohead protease